MPSQDYDIIISDIKSKKYAPIYLLQGEEPYFIDDIAHNLEKHVLNESEKAFNQTIVYGADTNAAYLRDTASRFPMMAPYQLIIVKEAQNIKDWENLENYAKQPPKSTILVLCHKYKKLDGKRKVTKHINASGVVFESKKIYDNKIPDWIKSRLTAVGLSIQPEAASLMAEHLGNDLSKIANELEKLYLHIPKGETIELSHIHKHVGISKEYNIFELQKALGQKDTVKAHQIGHYFISDPKNHSIIAIIAILYSYFSKVYKLHATKESNNYALASVLGVSPFFVNDYKTAARNYPKAKIEYIFHTLLEYDLKAKGFHVDHLNNENMLKELIFKILH